MDLNKLTKSELEKLLNEVVDATVDELVKGDMIDGGPTTPNHTSPGFSDDESEIDSALSAEGVAVKSEDCDEEADKKAEDEDEDDKEDKKPDFEEEKKSKVTGADLIKAQMKGMLNLNKAIATLNEKVDRLSKSKGRDRKSVLNEKDVSVIEKSNSVVQEDETIIKSNPKAFAKGLYDLQVEGKIHGGILTAYELYGIGKVPNAIRKSALQKANLIK